MVKSKFLVGDRVEVTQGCEDDEDTYLIGRVGTVEDVDGYGYCEVALDGENSETFQFADYQLSIISNT